MYDRKIPEDLECGINITMKVLGGKWQACIIDSINRGIRRPSDLRREITGASARVISMQLRELEEYNIVFKLVHPGLPLKVEYFLTELGQSILPVIDAIDKWGNAKRATVTRNTKSIEMEKKSNYKP